MRGCDSRSYKYNIVRNVKFWIFTLCAFFGEDVVGHGQFGGGGRRAHTRVEHAAHPDHHPDDSLLVERRRLRRHTVLWHAADTLVRCLVATAVKL